MKSITLLTVMLTFAACVKTIYVDRYLVPPCVVPGSVSISFVDEFTEEELDGADKCLRGAECTTQDRFVLNAILDQYARNLEAYRATIKKWEAYEECINNPNNKEEK